MSPPWSAHAMFPCLRDFEEIVAARADVLGMLYTGSLGRGTFDRFSDLDIHVWIDDSAAGGARVDFSEVMSWLGAVQFAYPRTCGGRRGRAGSRAETLLLRPGP